MFETTRLSLEAHALLLQEFHFHVRHLPFLLGTVR